MADGKQFDLWVLREREKQDAKWGACADMDIRAWVSVLAEESGEAVKAMCHVDEGKGGDPDELYSEAVTELVQVAATCRWIYENDVLLRKPMNRERMAGVLASVRARLAELEKQLAGKDHG